MEEDEYGGAEVIPDLLCLLGSFLEHSCCFPWWDEGYFVAHVSQVPRGLGLSLPKDSASCDVLAQVQVTGQEK